MTEKKKSLGTRMPHFVLMADLEKLHLDCRLLRGFGVDSCQLPGLGWCSQHP